MKPKSKVVKFDSSWFSLLPPGKRGDYRFMHEVARRVKAKGIRRGDLVKVRVVVEQVDDGWD